MLSESSTSDGTHTTDAEVVPTDRSHGSEVRPADPEAEHWVRAERKLRAGSESPSAET